MTVLELLHTYYIFEEKPHYSVRLLGYYLTTEDVEKTVALYRTVPGYCDTPNAFTIRRRSVFGKVHNAIYEAIVYAHTEDYEDYEHTAELGLFGNRKEAETAIETFHNDNKEFYKNTNLVIEEIINTYQLNRQYCDEGFVVERQGVGFGGQGDGSVVPSGTEE
jgi:hypothetical protein